MLIRETKVRRKKKNLVIWIGIKFRQNQSCVSNSIQEFGVFISHYVHLDQIFHLFVSSILGPFVSLITGNLIKREKNDFTLVGIKAEYGFRRSLSNYAFQGKVYICKLHIAGHLRWARGIEIKNRSIKTLCLLILRLY